MGYINRYPDGRIYKPKEKFTEKPNGTKNKYGNEKTELDGITFHSKREASHYRILSQLKKAGYIKDFKMQVKYVLLKGFRNKEGKKNQEIRYYADFDVTDLEDNLITIDSKGYETEVFKIKRKLFEHKFDRVLHTVKEDSDLHKMFIKE